MYVKGLSETYMMLKQTFSAATVSTDDAAADAEGFDTKTKLDTLSRLLTFSTERKFSVENNLLLKVLVVSYGH